MIPVLSTRNSTLPALISLMAFATSWVTVPVFGLGISPRGPRILPSLPTETVLGDRAGLRIGHQPARAEDLAEFADRAHHVGRGDHGVVIRPAFGLDLVDHV